MHNISISYMTHSELTGKAPETECQESVKSKFVTEQTCMPSHRKLLLRTVIGYDVHAIQQEALAPFEVTQAAERGHCLDSRYIKAIAGSQLISL